MALWMAPGQQPVQAGSAGGCGLTWGMYVANIPWDPAMTEIRNLDTRVGRHSAIVHYYAQWGNVGSGTFSANQPWMLQAVHNYSSVGVTGSIPLITWEPWSGGGVSNNPFPLKSIAAGKFDAYIDTWAVGLRGVGYTVYLDWGHEMDGNWYPWGYGVNGNTQADYIAAFRHVHDRFVAAGASNVKFVWNVNVWNPAGVDQMTFWPGSSYVDWMAIDVYNWGHNGGGWDSLAGGLTVVGTYSKVASLSSAPMMLAEWASAEPVAGDPPGVTKGQWIIDAANALGSQFPRVKAALWFSATGTTFAIDSSANSMWGATTAFGNCGAASPPPPPPPSPTPTGAPSPTPTQAPAPTPTPTNAPGSSPTPTHGASPAPTHPGGPTTPPGQSGPKSSPGAGGARPVASPASPKGHASPAAGSSSPSASVPAALLAAFHANDPGMGVVILGAALVALTLFVSTGYRFFLFFTASRRRRDR